ncbi:TRAP transporter large permease [Mesorhizobium microcysteis]|uniref:TRAP transporter large permease protein n=1 Tax=Neoaquamicrobium microcysteis TaxID=2682781 RepID=A0A5D4GZE3_9HYPH|nr:TRAP transporter large permease [Mesorhizobium microcysteis]TYR33554.1 TRAP transporter large permease [Mesorhizobium microcysteis]
MAAAGVGFLFSLILIFLRVPIAAALGITGFLGFGLLVGWRQSATMLAITTRDASMSYSLVVIPLFILMGNLIAGTGVSRELYRAAQTWLGGLKGGLANATIVSCAGFGMVCGSSVATVVTMGKVALPSMRYYGYRDSLSSATIAAGATFGLLLPPSVLAIVYGIITETHIGKLYAAMLIPGILGIVGYMAAVYWTCWRDPSIAPLQTKTPWKERVAALGTIWPVLLLFTTVLGGIYSGITTAAEASGIGALGAFLLALARRRLTWQITYDILLDSAQATAIIFGVLIGALVFTQFLNYTGAHTGLLNFVRDSGFSSFTVIVIICVIYLFLGAVMEELSMVLLTVPLFFPIVVGLGYDPVWFGVLVVILCGIGLITPPVGMNLFMIRTFAPDIHIMTIIRGIVPFVAVEVIRVFVLAAFPILATFLPMLLFN